MSVEAREFSMEAYSFTPICFVRFLCCVVIAEKNAPAAYPDATHPSIVSFEIGNAPQAVFRAVFSAPLVPHILTWRGRAKIGPDVIHAIAVDVIDVVLGPFARDYEPSEAMPLVDASIDPHANVIPFPGRARNLAKRMRAPSALDAPSQQSGQRIVGQDGTDVFGSQVIDAASGVWNALLSHLASFQALWSGFGCGVVSASPNPNMLLYAQRGNAKC